MDAVTPDYTETAFEAAALAVSPRVMPSAGYLPPMISHAQNFEDVMLRRALQDIGTGFYIDIGAADPDASSVTRWFYEHGWRGINVEPDPRFNARLAARRPEDTNLKCAISASSTNILLHIASPGASTGSARIFAGIGEPTTPLVVPTINLEQLFELSGGRIIDFLKIDVEGMEPDVLAGSSFAVHRPRVIVIEATLPNSQISSHGGWEPRLLSNGYRFAWFDGLNRFYVRQEDGWRLGFFKVPPCHFDNFLSNTINNRIADAAAAGGERAATIGQFVDSAIAHIEAIDIELTDARNELQTCREKLESKIIECLDRERDSSRAQELLMKRDEDCRRIQETLTQREEDCRRLQKKLAQRDEDCRRLQGKIMDHERERQHGLAVHAGEIQSLSAERDVAAEWGRRWFTAAIPADQDMPDWRQRYPLQARLYSNSYFRWIAAGPKRWRRALNAAADAARDRANWALAARYYRETLHLNPKQAAIWVQYGHALKEAGDLQGGEQAYRKALELGAGGADTYLQLGHVLKLQGKTAAAATAYRRSLALDPGSRDAQRELHAEVPET